MRRNYFIVAMVLPAPYCAPFLLRPRDIMSSQAGYPVARNSSNFFMRLPIIINSSIRKRACYAANGSCRLSQRAFNHRRCQQKRCGSRHLYRYAGCLSGAAFPTSGLHRIGTHSPRAMCRRHRAYPLLRLPIALSFDECGKSKCVHLVTFDRGKWQSTESLSIPVSQPLAVLKATASITEQLEQWRGIEQSPRLVGY